MVGCKIQNAPGAYLPAQGRVEVGSIEPEVIEEQPKVMPVEVVTPVEIEPEEEEKVEYVEEPKVVEEPIVEEPVVKEEEKELTRAERFTVVDDDDVVLKKYQLVIGSFGQKSNAQNLQRQMRPEYDPIIVINERGLYRVILKSYDTYAETKKKIESLRDLFPDAWVLIQQK